jgi:hypothetical protein
MPDGIETKTDLHIRWHEEQLDAYRRCMRVVERKYRWHEHVHAGDLRIAVVMRNMADLGQNQEARTAALSNRFRNR